MTTKPRKVILDVDPGIDDAVALTMALFDPRLEVVAVTAVAGNVSAEQATRNVQAILDQLDPPRRPRIGAGTEPELGRSADARHIFGQNGLGDVQFPVAELHHLHPAERVICEEVRAAPGEVTLVALGPLTNVARAFHREPALPGLVGHLVMMGGAVTAAGNVTPAAEFNVYCDPSAAQEVFATPATMTLVPLDVTQQVLMAFDFLEQVPPETTRAGRLLRAILPFAYRTHRQRLGLEGIHVHDAVALAAVTHPELFTARRLAANVETSGDWTLGATVFDRRPRPEWRTNLDVALEIDVAAVTDVILRCLQTAGQAG